VNNKWRKWAIIALAVLLPGLFVALRFSAERNFQKRLAAIRAAGRPASAAELDAWYKTVPASSNRALMVLEAMRNYVEPVKSKHRKLVDSPNADLDLSPGALDALASYLATNQPAIALLHQAASLPDSRYPMDLSLGPNTLLPHLSQIKRLADLLQLDAIYQAYLTNLDSAVRSLNAAFALADSLRDEPLLVSAYVRIQCVGNTVSALSRVLSQQALTEEQLLSLSSCVATAEQAGPRALVRSLVGERAINLGVFEMSFKEVDRLGISPFSSGSAGPFEEVGFQLYRASGIRQRDLALYLDTMEGFISSAQLNSPRRLQEFGRAETEFSQQLAQGLNRFAILSRMLLVPLTEAELKETNSAAMLRCAQVALAIERYRLDHGNALPATLDELAPGYLHKLPADPYDGSALNYERLPSKGYRVSAAGATVANRSYLSQNITNLVFTVFR
jgi:hypothetical protein